MRSIGFGFGAVAAALAFSAFAFAMDLPRPAPALDVTDPSGRHITLASEKGKVVVVQFLLTTCPHCQAFSEVLDRMLAEYGPKGLTAVGVAVNEATNKMAADYHSQYAKAFPVAAAPEQTALTFMGISVMDRPGFPQIAVIDRKGQIREQSSARMQDKQPVQDEQHLRALIEKLLAEPAVSAAKTPAAPVASAKKQ